MSMRITNKKFKRINTNIYEINNKVSMKELYNECELQSKKYNKSICIRILNVYANKVIIEFFVGC